MGEDHPENIPVWDAHQGWLLLDNQGGYTLCDRDGNVFTDGGFLRREEYDGSEWWEYEPPFRVPETQKPFKLVKARSYYTQLLVDINYPMKATEE